MTNQPQPEQDPVQFIADHPENHAGPNCVRYLADSAKSMERRIVGQVNIESHGNPAGINCFYTVYPTGDFFCWFIDYLHLFLVVLVNETDGENIKTVKVCSIMDIGDFQSTVASISDQMNIRNHYPVECGQKIMNPTADNSGN